MLRQPSCIMANDIREDFDASFSVLNKVAKMSSVASRSLPILLRIRDRVHQVTSHDPSTSPMADL